MKLNDFFKQVNDKAKQLGMVDTEEGRKKKNVIVRKNFSNEVTSVPFFGFIRPEEQTAGPYSDFSLVFFPTPVENKYVMSLGIGSAGFRNDYFLATQPGLRRLFLSILPNDVHHAPFCKVAFSDIETPISFSNPITETGVSLEKYKSVLAIGCLIDIHTDMTLVNAWIAQYAKIRDWASNQSQRNAIEVAISQCRSPKKSFAQQKEEVLELLSRRQFIVLQGAPGTGKTYLAEEIGANFYAKTFLTQFHAETSYADFVEGIMPKLDSEKLYYQTKTGILVEAIQYAKSHKNENILLIIDEINRANLANVLGPVFYLFESQRKQDDSKGICIGNLKINKIPDNLHVIATMNTADRSIAVVDFALRRRFAWYTIEPRYFETDTKLGKTLFDKVSAIFEKYATDAEMNLQPGGFYFMAKDVSELKLKMEYELMPLIKEYLDEGFLTNARNDFSDLFYQYIQKPLYQ